MAHRPDGGARRPVIVAVVVHAPPRQRSAAWIQSSAPDLQCSEERLGPLASLAVERHISTALQSER